MFQHVTSDMHDEEAPAPARPASPGSPRPTAPAPGTRTGAALPFPPWPTWEDAGDHERPPRRRRLLYVAAVVPWLVVVAVLLRPTETEPPAGPPPTASEKTATTRAGAHLAEPAPVGGSLVAPPVESATATAVRVARAVLGDRPPRPALPDGLTALGIPGYVESVEVEAIDHPAPGAIVVTVLAQVLQGEQRWDRLLAVRLGVPLRFDQHGARVGGTPWRLPTTELVAARLEVSDPPVDDPAVLADAGAALAAAGYGDVEVRTLQRTAAWPWIVTAHARAPGADTAGEHVVWLRAHLGGFVVAGIRPNPQETAP